MKLCMHTKQMSFHRNSGTELSLEKSFFFFKYLPDKNANYLSVGGFLNLYIIFFFCTVGRFQLDLHSNNMQALFIASQTPWGNKLSSKEKLSSANTSGKQKTEVLSAASSWGLGIVQPPALRKSLWFVRSRVGRRRERKPKARNSTACRISDVQPVL